MVLGKFIFKEGRKLTGMASLDFFTCRKKYGDIFSFYAGSRLIVVLNGYSAIHEALVKKCDVFSARPKTFISQQMAQGHGKFLELCLKI